MDRRKLMALVIWWCEGTKPRRDKRWKNSYYCPIEVINCDPKLVRIFADYLREDLGIPNQRLRGQIQIHEGDNQQEIEQYWVNAIGISQDQLNKTIIRKKGNKIGKNKGTFKLRLYGKALYEKLKSSLEDELRIISGRSSDG